VVHVVPVLRAARDAGAAVTVVDLIGALFCGGALGAIVAMID
jgi:hypothetical protein